MAQTNSRAKPSMYTIKLVKIKRANYELTSKYVVEVLKYIPEAISYQKWERELIFVCSKGLILRVVSRFCKQRHTAVKNTWNNFNLFLYKWAVMSILISRFKLKYIKVKFSFLYKYKLSGMEWERDNLLYTPSMEFVKNQKSRGQAIPYYKTCVKM